MAFQFGTNWGVLAQKTGSIQGPLLGYGAVTAFLTGRYTAEVGRQPWVVYGLLRTRGAVTPSLGGGTVPASLIG